MAETEGIPIGIELPEPKMTNSFFRIFKVLLLRSLKTENIRSKGIVVGLIDCDPADLETVPKHQE
jgi:hypothetical protein